MPPRHVHLLPSLVRAASQPQCVDTRFFESPVVCLSRNFCRAPAPAPLSLASLVSTDLQPTTRRALSLRNLPMHA
eukprot:4911768-Pleurochrysis_carterae.AAC.2